MGGSLPQRGFWGRSAGKAEAEEISQEAIGLAENVNAGETECDNSATEDSAGEERKVK